MSGHCVAGGISDKVSMLRTGGTGGTGGADGTGDPCRAGRA
jgi:hypothetical protein